MFANHLHKVVMAAPALIVTMSGIFFPACAASLSSDRGPDPTENSRRQQGSQYSTPCFSLTIPRDWLPQEVSSSLRSTGEVKGCEVIFTYPSGGDPTVRVISRASDDQDGQSLRDFAKMLSDEARISLPDEAEIESAVVGNAPGIRFERSRTVFVPMDTRIRLDDDRTENDHRIFDRPAEVMARRVIVTERFAIARTEQGFLAVHSSVSADERHKYIATFQSIEKSLLPRTRAWHR